MCSKVHNGHRHTPIRCSVMSCSMTFVSFCGGQSSSHSALMFICILLPIVQEASAEPYFVSYWETAGHGCSSSHWFGFCITSATCLAALGELYWTCQLSSSFILINYYINPKQGVAFLWTYMYIHVCRHKYFLLSPWRWVDRTTV